jgi:hypothetical protein
VQAVWARCAPPSHCTPVLCASVSAGRDANRERCPFTLQDEPEEPEPIEEEPEEAAVDEAYVKPVKPVVEPERQLSKKELKKKELEDMNAVLAELGIEVAVSWSAACTSALRCLSARHTRCACPLLTHCTGWQGGGRRRRGRRQQDCAQEAEEAAGDGGRRRRRRHRRRHHA